MEIDLELQHPSHHRSLPLQDVKEPQLFREQFPYTSICRTEFDDVVLAPHPADQLCITDTTFRDGQQARPPYTVSQVAKIFDFLHRLGGKTGLITASEFFMYSERDRKCIDACRARGYRFPRITGWIRANKNDLQLARDMEFSEVGMLTSVSDYHIFLKLGKTRKQAFDMYVDLVSQALEWGIIPRCHFEDVTRADIYGFCLPFASKLMELSRQAGMPVKIRLCDTMGYGVPYPGATLPRSVQRLVHVFIDEAGVPSQWLEWHGHNDFHKVLVNGVTAWLYGCGAVNSTLLGFGERTGNTPLEALVIEYISLTGNDAAADTTVITDNMPACLMQTRGVDVFTCAADAICLDGSVVNKVGTFQIAICAKYLGVPFYVTGVPDQEHPTGSSVRIETRNPDYVLRAMGQRTAAPGVRGWYPSFDLTPPELITGVVTDLGVYAPDRLRDYLSAADIGPFEMVI